MQGILRRLSTGPDRLLNVIKPMDIAQPIRSLPYVYLDTTRSRRLIEQHFGVPFRRPPRLPSRDWRFLRHDVEMCDELVAFELTARRQGLPFGYEPHFDAGGDPIYPEVTIHFNGLTQTLRPQPDKTLIIDDTRLILEHDCGQETIECGNIIRDATIGRKHLVYDQLFKSNRLQMLGWRKAIVVFMIDSRSGSRKASRQRMQRCLERIPCGLDATKCFFSDRQMAELLAGRPGMFVRGDGERLQPPCFSKSHN